METKQRTRLLSVAVLAVVLVSGVLLGLALDVRLDGGSGEGEVTEEARNTEGEDRRTGRRAPMYRQVGELDAGQEAHIDSIIDVHRDSMRELQREFSEAYDPRYWAIIENTRSSIRSILSPEQALKYDSLLAEYDRRQSRKDDEEDGQR